MRAAFAHYHRRAALTHEHHLTTYKDFFQPAPYTRSVILLGAAPCHGIQRRAFCPGSGLQSIIAANIVAANAAAKDPQDFGKAFHITRIATHLWEHDTLLHPQLLCKQFVRHSHGKAVDQRSDRHQSIAYATSECEPQSHALKSRRRPRTGPCHFKHPTTSLVDARGRPRWNAAPNKPPLWPG